MQRIEKQSDADTMAARYMRVSGTASDSGRKAALDLTIVAGVGCRGTISEQGLGSFQLISKGKTVWVRPDATFWKNAVGQHPSADQQLGLQMLAGKYLEDKAGTGLGTLASMCSRSGLLGSNSSHANTPMKKAGTAVIDGQRAVKFTSTDAKQPGWAYVSDTAKPELLQLTATGSDSGSLSFTYYTTAPAITPPPASEVIDGSTYGF